MQAWLKARGVDAKLLEKRSMNTCENTRFSSLLLQKKGGAPTVMLVTDEYHMPRTRRLFALNGIETIPVTAQCQPRLHVGNRVHKTTIIVVVQIMNYLRQFVTCYLVQVIVERCLNV